MCEKEEFGYIDLAINKEGLDMKGLKCHNKE